MVNALTSGVSDAAISAQGLSGCVIDDCGKRIVGRGRCRRHYQQWWKATRNTARPPALNLKTKTPEQRFQEKIDQRGTDDCWPWLASTVNGGHGEFFVSPQRGKIPAHSYALELASGQPCPPGMEACHRCDNPPCCNPTHIYFGTRQQNVDDMWQRNRVPLGSARRHSRLTEAQVVDIRRRCVGGESQKALAVAFAIGTAHVNHIVHGRQRKHVGGPIQPRPTSSHHHALRKAA
jgi:hypothetical protein